MSRAHPSSHVSYESKPAILGGTTVNLARISKLNALLCAIAAVLITSSAFAATAGKTRQLTPGEKATMSGLILSRDVDLVWVRDKKSHGGNYRKHRRCNPDRAQEPQISALPSYRHGRYRLTSWADDRGGGCRQFQWTTGSQQDLVHTRRLRDRSSARAASSGQ
jgi:hypothetical protein